MAPRVSADLPLVLRLSEGLGRSWWRVQGYPVSLAVDDDGSPAMRSDLMCGLQHLATESTDGLKGLVHPSFDIQINQGARPRRRIVAIRNVDASSHVVVRVWQETELKPRATFLGDFASEQPAIEGDSSGEIHNGDVHPHEAMTHGLSPRLNSALYC